jgi:hypothetical protein
VEIATSGRVAWAKAEVAETAAKNVATTKNFFMVSYFPPREEMALLRLDDDG